MKPDSNEQYGEEQANRIAYLVAGYLRQTLSEKEHDELDNWIAGSDENQVLFEELTDPVMIEKGLREMDAINTEEALERIKSKIHFALKKTSAGKRRILQYSIAASILLLAGLFVVYKTVLKPNKNETGITAMKDIPAGGNYAMLTLANGQTINLKAVGNGTIYNEQGTIVNKTNEGEINYETTGRGGTEVKYNVLITPAGGQYKVVLPDGSKVWLNASSSLKYPLVFEEKERVVELTGEGYFEIKPLSHKGGSGNIPFFVKTGNMKVEVLGTHFNINAYADEPTIKTTLLEGRVHVSWQRTAKDLRIYVHEAELEPGEQTQAGSDELKVISRDKVNVDEVIAWKNGKFQFKDEPIENIMRQLSRWYDAEIVYEGKKTDYHFNATIYRNEPVSKLLQLLEATERVHFSIEGKTIVVRP